MVFIEGGRVLTGVDSYRASLLVKDGTIAEIGRGLTAPPDAEVYDATGKLLLPGVIDAHVHVGLELKGHRSSGFVDTTRAAAFGGVTTFLTYVHPRPGQTLGEAVDERQAQASGECYVDYGLHAALINWNDREDGEISEMVERGIPSFKIYTTYKDAGLMSDDEQLRDALLDVSRSGGIVEVHCENDWIVERKTKRAIEEGRLSPADHATVRPAYAEGEAIAGVMRAAYDAGVPVYIVHVSTGEGVEAIDQARDLGIEVYAETCPHFLLLDEEKLSGEDGQRYATCPPLRAAPHRAALWEGLEDELIQVIATDHCEFLAADKDAGADDFRKLPMGLPGVETLLPLMWHFGVREGRMRECELVDRLSTCPAEIFGLHPRKGTLAPGSDADVVVFDPEAEVTIGPGVLHGYSDYSPYEGTTVKGWPVSTMVGGRWVVRDGELVGSPGSGEFVERSSVCRSPGNR